MRVSMRLSPALHNFFYGQDIQHVFTPLISMATEVDNYLYGYSNINTYIVYDMHVVNGRISKESADPLFLRHISQSGI